jgi:protein-L-isoaspartate O-methyltransferase
MSDWRSHALRLANQLQDSGDLRSPAWHAAIAETPRHVLVPTVYQPQQSHGSIVNTRLNTAEHLELVYSTSTLVTAVVPNKYGSLVPVSSSTKPDLMVRMLEALDVREGQRILEIETGTGYNAARRRLARIGRYPHLAARDGADGWPQHAPYHRIICTCAVRRIPLAWYSQLILVGSCSSTSNHKAATWCCLSEKQTGSKADSPHGTARSWSCASTTTTTTGQVRSGSLNSP